MPSNTPATNAAKPPAALPGGTNALTNTKPLAVLPDGIEIFRAGRHIDDRGVAHEFSEADLDGMATSYNPALREAPLTIGHPADNLPAYGWVSALKRNADGRLAMDARAVIPQFAEMVRDRLFPKRSASFYPPNSPNNPTPGKWYLRHVAFLGAQPPAVAGLKDIQQFSASDADGAVSFSESAESAPTPPTTTKEPAMTPEEMKAKIDAAEAKAKAAEEAKTAAEAKTAQALAQASEATQKAASFAEKARTNRKAGFVSFAETQVKAGRLLPKDTAMAVATLDMLAEAAPVEFSEGDTTKKVSPAQWLQDLIAQAKPVVSFGEYAPGSGHQPGAGGSKGKTDAEIDTDAKAYARQNKVSYAEALTAVTSFTS
jgi:hypothetical protein